MTHGCLTRLEEHIHVEPTAVFYFNQRIKFILKHLRQRGDEEPTQTPRPKDNRLGQQIDHESENTPPPRTLGCQ
ncbi:unnamed protein product [Gadus morhua 'NCC']